MVKDLKDYVKMLQKIKPGQQVLEYSPCKSKEVPPGKKGERKVLYGVCGSCMARYGKTEGPLHVSELLHPDVLGFPGCYG